MDRKKFLAIATLGLAAMASPAVAQAKPRVSAFERSQESAIDDLGEQVGYLMDEIDALRREVENLRDQYVPDDTSDPEEPTT